ITAIVLAALGLFRRLYVPQPYVNSAFLEAFAIYIAGFILISKFMSLFKFESLAWEWPLAALIPVVMLWVRQRGVDEITLHQGFGWHRGRGALVEIPLGIFGYFAGIPVMAAGFFISMKLIKHAGISPMHPIQKMLQGNVWQ